MTCGKYNDLSSILSKYDFNIDCADLTDITCVLCQRIFRNAIQTSCGCNFCWECIENYLGDSSKLCPSGRKCCANEYLTMSNDIQIDHRVNRNISFLVVKCPHDHCDVKDRLGNIIEHIRMCDKVGLECPFVNLGCNEDNIAKDQLTVHLHQNVLCHGTMVAESIKNINNELAIIKGFKEDIAAIERKENELRKEVEEQRIEIEALKSNNVNIYQAVNDLVSFKKSGFYQDVIAKIDDLETRIDKFTHKAEKPDDFIWKIDEFTAKQKGFLPRIKKEVTSSPFYTHKEGYRMRLKLHPNGYGAGLNTHLCVSFSIMKGDYDDQLEWPFRDTVNLSLLDQTTGEEHTTYSFNYDKVTEPLKDVFHKPKTQINKALGDDEFIKFEELFALSNVFVNDTLWIKCAINKS